MAQARIEGDVKESKKKSPNDATVVNTEGVPLPFRNIVEPTVTVTGSSVKQSETPVDDQRGHLRSDSPIGRLAAGAAHDLNNFLSPIISYAELALQDLSPDEVLFHDMEEILEAARCAHGITRQLSMFCKTEMARGVAEVDVSSAVNGFRKIMRRLLRENIVFDLRLSNIRGRVLCDPAQLDQILMNMTINAQDAMPDGGHFIVETATVEIDSLFRKHHPDISAGPKVLLAFTDTGVGMDAATVAHVFQHGFSTKGDRGNGIGLSIVLDIVHQTGGDIQVFSEPGTGTCFKIYLPRVVETKNNRNNSHHQRTNSIDIPMGHGEWILVVEEEAHLRRMLVRILDRYGYQVLEADCADEAMTVLMRRGKSVEIVMTNEILKGITAQRLGEHIRRLYPHIGLIYMSEHLSNRAWPRDTDNNRDVYLTTPFSPLTLAHTLQHRLRLQNASKTS